MSKNESVFYEKFKQFLSLKKQITFENSGWYDISTSVDFKFSENGIDYYVEIDSYNMAKCVLGQYVLLNQAIAKHADSVFVVIHFYKNYNKERTTNHLRFAQRALNCNLPFAVFHYNDLSEIISKEDFISLINSNRYC
jgi:hypothetical protein